MAKSRENYPRHRDLTACPGAAYGIRSLNKKPGYGFHRLDLSARFPDSSTASSFFAPQ
jgi:hypothetical protein